MATKKWEFDQRNIEFCDFLEFFRISGRGKL